MVDSSVKYTSENNFTLEENQYFGREAVMNTIHCDDYFSIDELEGIVNHALMEKAVVSTVYFIKIFKKCFQITVTLLPIFST